jgi:dTDP-4-dehydrorhamnose 3,5-epimerase
MLPRMDRLSIDGVWCYTPRIHADPRGTFHEAFKAADLPRPLDLAQVNCSVSRRGTLRGLHFADVPPGQAKYVMCLSGSVLDVVVDVRTGSPTFGQWESVTLDERSHRGLLVAEGIAHGFLALSEQATVTYLCSTPYAPGREHGIHPLDPDLAVEWPLEEEPLLSDKDAAAPTLKEAMEAGLLPEYAACQAFYAGLH